MTDAPSHTNLPDCPPWCTWPAGHPYTDEAKDRSYVGCSRLSSGGVLVVPRLGEV